MFGTVQQMSHQCWRHLIHHHVFQFLRDSDTEKLIMIALVGRSARDIPQKTYAALCSTFRNGRETIRNYVTDLHSPLFCWKPAQVLIYFADVLDVKNMGELSNSILINGMETESTNDMISASGSAEFGHLQGDRNILDVVVVSGTRKSDNGQKSGPRWLLLLVTATEDESEKDEVWLCCKADKES